jgi:hypothetical protein
MKYVRHPNTRSVRTVTLSCAYAAVHVASNNSQLLHSCLHFRPNRSLLMFVTGSKANLRFLLIWPQQCAKGRISTQRKPLADQCRHQARWIAKIFALTKNWFCFTFVYQTPDKNVFIWMNEWMVYLTASGFVPGGSITHLQTRNYRQKLQGNNYTNTTIQ